MTGVGNPSIQWGAPLALSIHNISSSNIQNNEPLIEDKKIKKRGNSGAKWPSPPPYRKEGHAEEDRGMHATAYEEAPGRAIGGMAGEGHDHERARGRHNE